MAVYRGRTRADLPPGRGIVTVLDDEGTVIAGPKPCRTVRARYDVAASTLVASAPTSCIGSPRWVQVAAGANRIRVTPQPDGSANLASWADDAFWGGLSITSMGRSPKVRRG
ncbi:hypothetical protein [Nocardioides hwasunensis]|uniref:Uncharacterized protein n=1 Tax=Nocardioides hwasunensis TaxID=397258 RepID=A0ABR8MB11_9ACTN|nr:hypothetical protein [Nocardioides hwasunensis]MBD3913053.1 hypothetical protein [Nocardioides hwasunensis]